MTKKKLLFIGALGTLVLGFLFTLDSHTCYISEICMRIRRFFNQDIFSAIFLAPVLLFFSLLTYPMKDEVFSVWWRFTRWFVPVIIIISFLLNGGGGGGLGISGAVSGAFNFLVICIFYLIFILVSLIKIIREYKRTKI